MSYYGANVGARLRMGTSTTVPLPAPGADTFTDIPLLGTVTPPPNVLSTGFFNVLNDGNRRSVGGKLNDQTVPGNLVINWLEAVHNAMFEDSKIPGGRKRNWQLVYPDVGGRVLDFVGFVSEWTEEPFQAEEDAVAHRANFVVTADGAVTATA